MGNPQPQISNNSIGRGRLQKLMFGIILMVILINSSSTTAATTSGSSKKKPYSSIMMPITKDDAKLQYYTTMTVGSARINAVIDTGNLYSWVACDAAGYSSGSSTHMIPCDSSLCNRYDNGGSFGCVDGWCGAIAYTPWGDGLHAGALQGDTITASTSTNNANVNVSVPRFPFTCAGTGPLKGLSQHTKGVVSLARTPASIQAHISTTMKIPHKFALCLPSSSSGGRRGAILFGGGPYKDKARLHVVDFTARTRLIVNPNSTAPMYTVGQSSVEYYVALKGIRINGKSLARRFNRTLLGFDKEGHGGTKISTLGTPYTKLHPQIYKAFLDLFVREAKAMGLARVSAPVSAPFEACFRHQYSNNNNNNNNNNAVPVIDFQLKSTTTATSTTTSSSSSSRYSYWRFTGSNSMVKLDSVQCLAFVKGDSEENTAVVIGGYQMEDTLVEFDLESSTFGISSNSLLRQGTTCSQLI